jgi:hypothetical protein
MDYIAKEVKMPGPNSCPNGDTTVMRGHINEEFYCDIHKDKHLDECYDNEDWWPINPLIPHCRVIPKREWLAKRGRLRTGKTV